MDESILQRIAAGDESAVQRCLDQYGGLVWSLAKRLCRSDAEDATQEIFVEIWQKASAFDPARSSEASFVTMIARRRLIDRIRRSGNAVQSGAIEEDMVDATAVDALNQVELSDEAAKAADCMTKLSKPQQSILTLSIHHGASHSSISAKLAMPLGTVKSFARRALLQLRDCMQRPAPQINGTGS